MTGRKPISLDETLAQNAERIFHQVVKDLLEKGGKGYQKLPAQVLEMRVQRLFDAFWQGMSQRDAKPMVDYIWATGRDRGNEGFTVGELQTVGMFLRDALLQVVDEVYADNAALHLRYSRRIENLILTGLGTGVRGFVDGREALIARQYKALQRNKE